jgi:hypothetical protein
MKLNVPASQLYLMTCVVSLSLLVGIIVLPAERQIAEASDAVAQLAPELDFATGTLASKARVELEYAAARSAALSLGVVADEPGAQRTLSRVVPRLAREHRVQVTDLEIASVVMPAAVPVATTAPGRVGATSVASTADPDGGYIPITLKLDGGYDDLRRFMSALPHEIPLLEEQTWTYESASRSVFSRGERVTVNVSCVLHLPSMTARQGLETDLRGATSAMKVTP